jgi:hypothetical protein
MEVAKRDAQAYVIDWLEKSSRERNLWLRRKWINNNIDCN